jgi:putative oxidoreductase
MRGLAGIDPGWGVTVVRVVMAVILITAGWQKFNAGTAAAADSFAKMGFAAPWLVGVLVMALELIGGLLLLIGVAGRWLGLLFAIQFLVATAFVKLPSGGLTAARLDLMLLAAGVLFLLAGSGRAAVDELWLERASREGARMPRAA